MASTFAVAAGGTAGGGTAGGGTAGGGTAGGGGDTVSIVGDVINGKVTWVLDGTPLPNNGTVQLKKGQLVRFSVKTAKHGILFQSQAAAEAVFDIAGSPQASKFKLNPNPGGACSTATTYGTTPQDPGGDNIIAELKVRADTTVTSLPFECSQHCSAMASTFTLGDALNIVGDFNEDGKRIWRVNGKQLANGTTVPLIPGQTVRFSVAQGAHGLLFPDEATANAIFDIANSPQKNKFKLNPSRLDGKGNQQPNTCNLPDSYGTDAQLFNKTDPGANLIAELKVKQPFDLAEPGQWMCTEHCQAMQGLFVPRDTSFVVADPENRRWLIDNEPLANNTSVTLEPGKKVRFSSRTSGQTLFFRDKDAPAALFESAAKFSPMNLCSANGSGLTLKSGGYDEVTVKKPLALMATSFMAAPQCERMEGLFQPVIPAEPFRYPPPFDGAKEHDPYTPLMRAYPGETVEIRTLVGAHMAPHSFNMHGVKWLFEQNSQNSGFRSTQGMGISEYYQMRFEVPTTNAGADYLYATTSDVKGLEYGQWGLLRAYDKVEDDLPRVGSPPQQTAAVCPNNAPMRSYRVSAVAASRILPEGYLVYNSRGDAGGGAKIVAQYPFIYLHDDDLVVTPNKIELKPGKQVEPLILRAAAGDCIEVTVTNRFLPTFKPPSRVGTGPAFANITLYTSRHVSLHPQQVGMDILTGNGVTIGNNPSKTVWKTGESAKLQWYAGSIGADGTHTPVELGAIGLSPADPLMQHPFGMLGALIIEPQGSTWKEDDNSRAQATVTSPSGKFREFVLVLQDDVKLGLLTEQADSYGKSKKGPPQVVQEVAEYSRAFNYRTEPLPYRFEDTGWDSTSKSLAPLGMARALSNSQVAADPQTPVLAVSKGTPTRLRVVHPGGLSEQTFTLNGHPWQEEPFRNNSRDIGDNGASQWFGGRDAFGANDQFNLVLNSAGGRNKVTGDYLYRSFIGSEFQYGLWGLVRVGQPGEDIVTIAGVAEGPNGYGYAIAGTNTVNPDTGKMADKVTISASVRKAGSVVKATCTVPVDAVTGAWTSAANCSDAGEGKLIVDGANPVMAQSTGGGRASVNGFIPALKPPVALSAQQRSQNTQAKIQKGNQQTPEIVQFRGERIPPARVPGEGSAQRQSRADPIPNRSPRPDAANQPTSASEPDEDEPDEEPTRH
ncbi:MAG TPA: hypothetical protein VEL76_19495 [Gemmataceae bacterium]|nr:hypothetical protein [Gemmataceae bacterium]